MEKPTAYFLTVVVICLTILGVGGEYFLYKYSLSNSDADSSSQANSNPVISQPQLHEGSAENAITAFSFQSPRAVGTINQADHTVTIIVPPDTNITRLTPTITVSNNATVAPASGAQKDFMNPVTYSVTAQNGGIQQYKVTVNVASSIQSVEKLITAFSLAGFTPATTGYINKDTHAIYITVPDGTDITRLTPIIKISSNATVSPASGIEQNFTNSVIYTVTDVYGDTQDYTVTVVTQSNSG